MAFTPLLLVSLPYNALTYITQPVAWVAGAKPVAVSMIESTRLPVLLLATVVRYTVMRLYDDVDEAKYWNVATSSKVIVAQDPVQVAGVITCV